MWFIAAFTLIKQIVKRTQPLVRAKEQVIKQ